MKFFSVSALSLLLSVSSYEVVVTETVTLCKPSSSSKAYVASSSTLPATTSAGYVTPSSSSAYVTASSTTPTASSAAYVSSSTSAAYVTSSTTDADVNPSTTAAPTTAAPTTAA
ncbi:hypothetical protein AYI69_g2683, partial [Smittium culicis]